MNQINFNQAFLNPNGEPYLNNNKPITLGNQLGNTLFTETSAIPDPIKWDGVAKDIHQGKEISISDEDVDFLKNYIKTHPTMPLMLRSQLLQVLIKPKKTPTL